MRTQLFGLRALKIYRSRGYLKGEEGFSMALPLVCDYSPLILIDNETDYLFRAMFGEGWGDYLAEAIKRGILLDNTGVKNCFLYAPFFTINYEATAFKNSIELRRIAKMKRFFVDYEDCEITQDSSKGGPLEDYLNLLDKASRTKGRKKDKKQLIKIATDEWILKAGERKATEEERNKRISEGDSESEGRNEVRGKSEELIGTLPLELNNEEEAPANAELNFLQINCRKEFIALRSDPSKEKAIRERHEHDGRAVLRDLRKGLETEEDKQAFDKIFKDILGEDSNAEGSGNI